MSSGSSSQQPIGPDPAVKEAIDRGHAVVFLDVALGEGDNMAMLGRIQLELFIKDVSNEPSHNVDSCVWDRP